VRRPAPERAPRHGQRKALYFKRLRDLPAKAVTQARDERLRPRIDAHAQRTEHRTGIVAQQLSRGELVELRFADDQ
jgi:hypothetical protein